MFTWLAFFGISAVAAYSVFGLFQELQRWVIKAIMLGYMHGMLCKGD
jgi:hypothetical protein